MPVINSILDTCLERQTQKAVCETQKILGKSVMKLSYSHLEQPRMKDFIQRVQECIVYLILVYKVVFSGMLIGDFSMYLTGIGNFSSCLQSIISSFSGIRKSGDFAADFRYCVEMADTMENTEIISVKTDSLCSIEFEFRNVSFKYPNTDRMILKNISLKIKAGESLSLVGVNGAGKTTLVKLLCRLYEPTDGEIFMNGVPIQEFPYDTYRPLIGVVFQDFKTFAFSVAENVALQTSYDEKRVTECMAESDILDKG